MIRSNVVRLESNGGKTAVPGALSADPVHATGQTLIDAATGADHTATVVGGKSYLFVGNATGMTLFGILAVTTAANIAWACPVNGAIVINVPQGEATLHYMSNVNGGGGYLTEIKRNPLNQ